MARSLLCLRMSTNAHNAVNRSPLSLQAAVHLSLLCLLRAELESGKAGEDRQAAIAGIAKCSAVIQAITWLQLQYVTGLSCLPKGQGRQPVCVFSSRRQAVTSRISGEQVRRLALDCLRNSARWLCWAVWLDEPARSELLCCRPVSSPESAFRR